MIKLLFIFFPLILLAEIPSELKLLVPTLQSLLKKHPELIDKDLQIIDFYYDKIDENQLYPIIKTIYYKNLLFSLDSAGDQYTIIDDKFLNFFTECKNKLKNPFLVWLASALESDTKNLMADNRFNEYIKLKRGAAKQFSSEIKKLDQKAQILFRWKQSLQGNIDDSFEQKILNDLHPTFQNILHQIAMSMLTLTSTKEQAKIPSLKSYIFKHFKVKDLPRPTKEDWLND